MMKTDWFHVEISLFYQKISRTFRIYLLLIHGISLFF